MTQLIKVWELPGGIHPPENKHQSMRLPLKAAPIPPQVILPVHQHIGNPAKPVVAVGDKVLKGQLIAAAVGTFSANIHASTSGVVSAITQYPFPHASGMTSECIVIDTDGEDRWTTLEPCLHFLQEDRSILLEKIRAAGVAGLGGAGFPTAIKLTPKSIQKIDTLVINGAECEPYITADDQLMQDRADELIRGTLLLAHILHNPTNLLIGIEDNKPLAIAAINRALNLLKGQMAGADRIQVVAFPTKYPSGGAKQLVQILTGREIPSGRHSADVGVICINVGTAVAAYRAVRFGEPLISRITTFVGETLTESRNLEVLVGTPIDFLLAQQGHQADKGNRVIMGGPMMGFTLPDLRAPIIKTTNCIMAPSITEMPLPDPAQACIRCGHCAEVCPASLLPQQLFWYAQAGEYDRLEAHNLFDCIECGACAYVCPSSIPLVQYYRAAKGHIRLANLEKEKSDRSRQRFEFRQSRIAKEEAEKEAKRLARQKAAEEAKKKLAEKQAQSASDTPIAAADPVAAAVAKAQAAQPSQDELRAKLERQVAAAKNALEFAQKPLAPQEFGEAISEEKLEKQRARIKQAELKVAEAEKKLNELSSSTQATSEAPTAVDDDPVARAIAKAQAKMNQSPAEKLRDAVEQLHSRISKAQERVEQARVDNAPTLGALEQALVKLQDKLRDTQTELSALGEDAQPTPAPAVAATIESAPVGELDAAAQAIEKAKAKAAALAAMSDDEKRAEQIKSLEQRLQKARERLGKAEIDNDPNLDAFKASVIKLEEKLAQLQA